MGTRNNKSYLDQARRALVRYALSSASYAYLIFTLPCGVYTIGF